MLLADLWIGGGSRWIEIVQIRTPLPTVGCLTRSLDSSRKSGGEPKWRISGGYKLTLRGLGWRG